MNSAELAEKLLRAVEKRVPEYLKNPVDKNVNNGNVSLVIIDETGNIWGKMFGTDKISMRSTAQTAWRKASQVWITGYPTGKFEELIFTRQLDWTKFGIMKPDYIGWEGGLPVVKDGKQVLSAAFSGFRGEMDMDIIDKSIKEVLGG